MNWSTYLVFPESTEGFDPTKTPWYNRPSPIKLIKRARYTDIQNYSRLCQKEFDLTRFPSLGKLLAGSIRNYLMGDSANIDKRVESINIFLDEYKKVSMRIHRLGVNGEYTAAAVTYNDTAYSYEQQICIRGSSGDYWKPNHRNYDYGVFMSWGNLPSLDAFGYDTRVMQDDSELDLLAELTRVCKFESESLNDYLEFTTLDDDLTPDALKKEDPNDTLNRITDLISDVTSKNDQIIEAIENLDVSNFDTSNLGELITECNGNVIESLSKLTEQSSQLDVIQNSIEEGKISLSDSIGSFSANLNSINEFYGTRIFEIEELKAELSSFYDKAIAAWRESIESISESLTASAQAGSVALDINQALDSLKSNLKRVETLASIFDKASTVSGEISTNAQIVGTAVSTLSSLLLSFNESVNGYEKTLLSLVENVRQNLDLFLHSSDSVFQEARRAISDTVVTNAISKSLDVINSLKKKETL